MPSRRFDWKVASRNLREYPSLAIRRSVQNIFTVFSIWALVVFLAESNCGADETISVETIRSAFREHAELDIVDLDEVQDVLQICERFADSKRVRGTILGTASARMGRTREHEAP